MPHHAGNACDTRHEQDGAGREQEAEEAQQTFHSVMIPLLFRERLAPPVALPAHPAPDTELGSEIGAVE